MKRWTLSGKQLFTVVLYIHLADMMYCRYAAARSQRSMCSRPRPHGWCGLSLKATKYLACRYHADLGAG